METIEGTWRYFFKNRGDRNYTKKFIEFKSDNSWRIIDSNPLVSGNWFTSTGMLILRYTQNEHKINLGVYHGNAMLGVMNEDCTNPGEWYAIRKNEG